MEALSSSSNNIMKSYFEVLINGSMWPSLRREPNVLIISLYWFKRLFRAASKSSKDGTTEMHKGDEPSSLPVEVLFSTSLTHKIAAFVSNFLSTSAASGSTLSVLVASSQSRSSLLMCGIQ